MQVAGEHVGAAARRSGDGRARSRRARTARRRRACRGRAADRRRGRRGCRARGRARATRARAASARPRRASPRACARAECRKSPRKTIAARAPGRDQRRQRGQRLARRAARHRHAESAKASPPCRCAHRRRAACGWRRGTRPFRRSRVSGRPAGQDRRRHGARLLPPVRLRTGAARRRGARSGSCLNPGAREALQAADRERCQRRRLRAGVDGRRLRAGAFGDLAQALAQLRLDPLEELVHARGEAIVLEHQRVADHHPRHARGSSRRTGAARRAPSAPGRARRCSRSTIWLTSVKTLCSMNSISPSNICALLAK